MEDILLRVRFECQNCHGKFPIIDRHEAPFNGRFIYACPACAAIIENQLKINEK